MAEKPKENPQLPPGRLRSEEYAHNVWVATAPFGVTREQLKEQTFWSHVAAQMRPRDELKVFAEDGTYFAHYLVLSCDRTWAVVHELAFVPIGEVSLSEQALDDYEVKFRGPKKWSVVRKSDNKVLQEGLHSQAQGEEWLQGFINNPSQVAA